MILERIRIIVGDAGFKPGASGSLIISHHISLARVHTSVVDNSGTMDPDSYLNPDLNVFGSTALVLTVGCRIETLKIYTNCFSFIAELQKYISENKNMMLIKCCGAGAGRAEIIWEPGAGAEIKF